MGDFWSPATSFYASISPKMFSVPLWLQNSANLISCWIWSADLQVSSESPRVCGGSWNRNLKTNRINTPKGIQLVWPLQLTVCILENFYCFKRHLNNGLPPLNFCLLKISFKRIFVCVYMKNVYIYFMLYESSGT